MVKNIEVFRANPGIQCGSPNKHQFVKGQFTLRILMSEGVDESRLRAKVLVLDSSGNNLVEDNTFLITNPVEVYGYQKDKCRALVNTTSVPDSANRFFELYDSGGSLAAVSYDSNFSPTAELSVVSQC